MKNVRKNARPKEELDYLTVTEKSLKITYWVTKIVLAVAWAKQHGLLEWIN